MHYCLGVAYDNHGSERFPYHQHRHFSLGLNGFLVTILHPSPHPSAVMAKLEKNARKYPADKVRGSSKKYTEYTNE
jgi:hypothetical protein